jgi:hypothetical protein
MEEEECDFEVVTDNPEPDFKDLTVAALKNAGIGRVNRLRTARAAADAMAAALNQHLQQDGPHLAKAYPEKIVYEITVELPDTGLLPSKVPNAPIEPVAADDETVLLLHDDIQHNHAGV